MDNKPDFTDLCGVVISRIKDYKPTHSVLVDVPMTAYYQDGKLYYKRMKPYDEMDNEYHTANSLVYDIILSDNYMETPDKCISPNECQIVKETNNLSTRDMIISCVGGTRIGGKYIWSVVKEKLLSSHKFSNKVGVKWLDLWKRNHNESFVKIKNKLYADYDLIEKLFKDINANIASSSVSIDNSIDCKCILASKQPNGEMMSLQKHVDYIYPWYIPKFGNLFCHYKAFDGSDSVAMKMITILHDLLKCKRDFQDSLYNGAKVDHFIGSAMIAYELCKLHKMDNYTTHACVLTILLHHYDVNLLNKDDMFRKAVGHVMNIYPNGLLVDNEDGVYIKKFYADNYNKLRRIGFRKTDYMPGVDSRISSSSFVNWLNLQVVTDKDVDFIRAFRNYDKESHEILQYENLG